MRPRFLSEQLLGLIMICVGAVQCNAQTPVPSPQATPTPGDAQEKVKVFTEEVVIPVTAYDNSGHLKRALTCARPNRGYRRELHGATAGVPT